MSGYQAYPNSLPYGYYGAFFGNAPPVTTVEGKKFQAFPLRFGPVRGMALGIAVASQHPPPTPPPATLLPPPAGLAAEAAPASSRSRTRSRKR